MVGFGLTPDIATYDFIHITANLTELHYEEPTV